MFNSAAVQGAQRASDAAAVRQASGGTDAAVIADDVFGYGTLLADRRAIAAPARLQHHASAERVQKWRGGEWAKVFSPKHGRAYYVNTCTGQRSWTAPGGGGQHADRSTRRLQALELERSHGRTHTRPSTGAKYECDNINCYLCLLVVAVIALITIGVYYQVKQHEKSTCERKALCSWTKFHTTPECAWSNATDSCTNQGYVNVDYDAGGSATKMCKWGQDALSETCCKRCGDAPPVYECGCVTKETARKNANKKNRWKSKMKTSLIALAAVSLPCSIFLLLKYSRNWENTPVQKCCRRSAPSERSAQLSSDKWKHRMCFGYVPTWYAGSLSVAGITFLIAAFTWSVVKEEHGYYNGCPGAFDDMYDVLFEGCPE